MNENIEEKVVILPPFKHMIMTIGELPSSYLETMSYYEMLVWFSNYLGNTVIPAINENGEAVEELQNLFVELQNYVNNYFDNLDVQEEINNKLDEMAQDGTLGNIILTKIQPIIDAEFDAQNEIINGQNSRIDTISNIVQSVSSGSPSGVYPTVSDLTTDDPDHSKIYVVTADGNWYYYNSSTSTWTSGGVYQSSEIGDNTINKYMLDTNLQDAVFENMGYENLAKINGEITNFSTNNSNIITQAAQIKSVLIPIEANTTYRIEKSVLNTDRFVIATLPEYPVVGGEATSRITTYNSFAPKGIQYSYVTTGANDKYILFYFYNTNDVTPSYDEAVSKLNCFDVNNYSLQLSGKQYNEENINKLRNDIEDDILVTKGTPNIYNPYDENQFDSIIPGTGTKYVYSTDICSIIFPIKENTSYTIKRNNNGGRFRYSLSNGYPFPALTEYHNNTNADAQTSIVVNNTSYSYLVLYFWISTSGLSLENAKQGITIYESANPVENVYKFDNLLNNRYLKLVSYRPLGTLQKGYIAISSDDGRDELADITVDIFKGYKTTYGKNIPLTMGLMETSEIFDDDTRKAKVLDLINNYGSSVAIHGSASYTTMSQNELFEFLDEQKQYLTTNLTAPSSIIYPNHDYNELTATISGTYYSVCCTGGNNNPITYGGDSKLAGARSNQYTLYRFSLFNAQMTNQKIKDAIDYAYENNMIFLPFFHDIDLDTDYERCKALLDYCVDYANSKGLEFINVGDIPNII